MVDKKVIGYFEDNNQAQQAAQELKNQGYKEISILGNDDRGNQGQRDRRNNNGGMNMGLSSGTMTGGTLGGLAGLALGAGALAIPGLGPIIAMGPLAAAIGGAVTGGVAGALVDYGIPKEQSDYYESKLREGKTIMVIKTQQDKSDQVASIMKNYGAREVKVH